MRWLASEVGDAKKLLKLKKVSVSNEAYFFFTFEFAKKNKELGSCLQVECVRRRVVLEELSKTK